MNARDEDAIQALCSPELVLMTTVETHHGPKGAVEWLRRVDETFDGYRAELVDLEEVNGHLVATVHQEGRGKESGLEVDHTFTHVWTLPRRPGGRDARVPRPRGRPRLRPVRLSAVRHLLPVALACVALAGCGGDDEPRSADSGPPTRDPPSSSPAGRLAPPPCPAGLSGCRRASGRIVYVERVDPDGDGDAHFVLLSRSGITGPGVTVVDVKRSLRPRPLPGIGDRLAAAGPVFTGSYGQRQIEAVAVRVRR